MPESTNTLDWSIELTAADRDGDHTIVISRDNSKSVHISSIRLSAREDVAATSLEIRFPSLQHFYDAWDITNYFAHGSMIQLKVEGVLRFTGVIDSFSPIYAANDRSCVIVAYDKMRCLKDAVVEMVMKRRVIREKVNLTRHAPGSFFFESAPGTYPWAEDYLIPVWVQEPVADGSTKSYRVFFDEYKIVYDIGAIYFNYDQIKIVNSDVTVDPDGDGDVVLDDYDTEIWAEIAYYDTTDLSTRIDNVLTTLFEYDANDSGIGWTDGVDFNLEETPQDILNKMEWHTKQGDGDAQAFISHLYDNPKIGFPINYWIRDFEGAGVVTGKYIYQQSGLVFNDDFEVSPDDYPAGNWVYDAVAWTYDGVNGEMDKDANGTGTLEQEIYMREGETYRIHFVVDNRTAGDVTPSLGGTAGAAVSADGSYIQYIVCGADGETDYTKTLAFTPSNAARLSVTFCSVSMVPKDVGTIYDAAFPSTINDVYTRAILVNNESTAVCLTRGITPTDLMAGAHDTTETPDPTYFSAPSGTDCLTDGHSKSAWGYFKIAKFDLDEPLPQDQAMLSIDLGESKEVDRIIYCVYWTFTGDPETQPWLHDDTTGFEATNGLYLIYEPQRITIEANTSTTAVPDVGGWYPIHPELFMAESTPGTGTQQWDAKDSWQIVEDIGITTRHLRVVANNPLFGKVGESNWANEAYRIMIWWINEIQVYSKNRLLDSAGILPEVRFSNWANEDVAAVSVANDWFEVAKDITGSLVKGEVFTVTGSTGNDGTYTCDGDPTWTGTATRITVVEDVTSAVADGQINNSYRYRFGINNTLVDMYRPTLMSKMNAYTNDTPPRRLGLKCKPLIIESDDLFDFQQKLAVDPGDVSIGYKYLVSRLDAASRENEWTVRVDPRPDILIGDTIFCSALDADKYFLVHGSDIELTATSASQSLIVSDHDALQEVDA